MWRLHQGSLWTQQQQERRSSFSSSSSWRAASNSAASSAREEEEEDAAGADSSTSTERGGGNAAVSAPSSAPSTSTSTSTISYVAPLSTTVHRLKRLSLFSCLLTTAAAPTLAATESMPPAARATAAVGIAGFGLFTTGLLHWFVGPYVHELTWRRVDDDGADGSSSKSSFRGEDSIEVTTLDVLGRKTTRSLPLSRVAAPPDGSIHPQATFSDSETGKLYYIDVDNFVSVAASGSGDGEGDGDGDGGGKRQRQRQREEAAAALLGQLVVAEEGGSEGEKEK